jgi:hypothetical protein
VAAVGEAHAAVAGGAVPDAALQVPDVLARHGRAIYRRRRRGMHRSIEDMQPLPATVRLMGLPYTKMSNRSYARVNLSILSPFSPHNSLFSALDGRPTTKESDGKKKIAY